MIWSTLLSPVTDLVGGWVKGRQKIKEAKLDVKLAQMENTARLLREKEGYNAQWEQAQLAQTDRLLRWLSFLILSTPFVSAAIFPEQVQKYFTVALAAIPEWYQAMYMAIIGAIWGIAELKNSLPALIGGLKGAIKK